ncbi:MAG: hypothetical protein GF346_06730 [Candidatus Eisenbacteria bacterium]|nr:hypothetical protein [Candidatus Latescibacterota bacterium]MBD3302123.1 hypothetical protein [Candidatus Eisenbacteria bacterium]
MPTLVSLIAALSLAGAADPAPAGPAASTLRIVYTAEVRGNLLPCVCPTRPLGGLARRIGWVDSLRTASTVPTVVVDAGALLPGPAFYPLLAPEDLAGLRALHVEAAERIGYAAIVGEPAGPEEGSLPWLPPNRSRTVEVAGRSIRFVAVGEDVPFVAEEGLPASVGSADLTVLLCDGDLHLALRSAPLVKADVAVVSRGALYRSPLERGGTLFLGPGAEGKQVGAITVQFAGTGEFRLSQATLRPMDRAVPVPREWQRRVEETVLWLERRSPSGLAPAE